MIFEVLRPFLQEKVFLSRYVTFHTGGPADYFFEPDSLDVLKKGLELFSQNNLPIHVLGDGSNTLIHDHGFRGVVIRLQSPAFSALEKIGDLGLRCGPGVKNHRLAAFAAEQGVEGFDFLCGFPGTLGGSIFGNAGSSQETLGMRLKKILCLTKDGQREDFSKDQFDFHYRAFPLLHNKIIVEMCVEGIGNNIPEKIYKKNEQVRQTRRAKDPKGFTCGSVFKNPEGTQAWKVIDQIGFRGKKIGGAHFSETHPNWILCEKNARSEDIWTLIQWAQSTAHSKLGILLEHEVRLLGDFKANFGF
jgi:UDP-N-acetylenolpyruvoylglucosamine reductase